jgi:hypothetical protein
MASELKPCLPDVAIRFLYVEFQGFGALSDVEETVAPFLQKRCMAGFINANKADAIPGIIRVVKDASQHILREFSTD